MNALIVTAKEVIGYEGRTPAPFVAATPVPVARDFAPKTPIREKWAAFLRYPDGRLEQWLLSKKDLDAFRSEIPSGARLEILAPPAILMGHEAPRPTPPGTQPTGEALRPGSTSFPALTPWPGQSNRPPSMPTLVSTTSPR